VRRVLPLLLVSALLVAGCGSKSSSNPSPSSGGAAATSTQPAVHFAKTKFAFHAGLAFGVFHRWIYKPFKKGEFNHPLSHKIAFVKGLIAAAFVYHEVKLAREDARHSKLLSKVVLPLLAVGTAALAIRSALQHHRADAGAINSAESSISSAKAASSAAGQPITETTKGAPAGL
jgi:hypothetical protein